MNYKRIVLSMFMLLGMAVGTKAQNGTLTLKLRPGEVMMETTELTADDNFTYLLNEDDLAAFADWLYQGDGRGNIMVNDCLRYVKSITMAFDVPSGVRSLISNPSQSDEAWYTLDGRKLSGVPTKPGVYVVGGRKILIGNKR